MLKHRGLPQSLTHHRCPYYPLLFFFFLVLVFVGFLRSGFLRSVGFKRFRNVTSIFYSSSRCVAAAQVETASRLVWQRRQHPQASCSRPSAHTQTPNRHVWYGMVCASLPSHASVSGLVDNGRVCFRDYGAKNKQKKNTQQKVQ